MKNKTIARDLSVGDTILVNGEPKTLANIKPYGESNHSVMLFFEGENYNIFIPVVDKLTEFELVEKEETEPATQP